MTSGFCAICKKKSILTDSRYASKLGRFLINNVNDCRFYVCVDCRTDILIDELIKLRKKLKYK